METCYTYFSFALARHNGPKERNRVDGGTQCRWRMTSLSVVAFVSEGICSVATACDVPASLPLARS